MQICRERRTAGPILCQACVRSSVYILYRINAKSAGFLASLHDGYNCSIIKWFPIQEPGYVDRSVALVYVASEGY